MAIRIVTDSSTDITHELARELGVDAVISAYVVFGDKAIPSLELTPSEFHRMMRESPIFPKTSQPSIGDCVEVYERFKEDEVLSIHISRELSGTYSSAEAASRLLAGGGPSITLIDTRQVSAGAALLVMEAVEMVKRGVNSAAEIAAHIQSLIPRTRMHFVLETLENLRRGGRIGSVRALLGNMLQMKPLLTICDGRIEPLERVRTFNKAVARLKEVALKELSGVVNPRVCVMHAAAQQLAQDLAKELAERLGIHPPRVIEAGPAICVHSGPGAVGISYIA
ncbi:MAG: DegV family protein [Thermoflexales bacterium]